MYKIIIDPDSPDHVPDKPEYLCQNSLIQNIYPAEASNSKIILSDDRAITRCYTTPYASHFSLAQFVKI